MFGERLKLARKKAGLSLDRLVESINGLVTKQAISKYERNQMMPDSKVLIELAKALDVTVDYLFSDRVADLIGVDFRKEVRTSAKDRARVEASVIDHMERYLAIEEVLELESTEWNPPDLFHSNLESIDDAELLARELRVAWDLGEDPIPDMTLLLEDYGIKVLLLELPKRVSGMTCFAATGDKNISLPVVVINKNQSLERRRFTLAHELAHRVFNLGDQFVEQEEERAAQLFAGAFLMHADHLKKEVGTRRDKFGYKEIVYLKRMYRVSAAALVMRLEQIGIIAKSTVSTIFQTIGRKWRTIEPDPIEPEENRGEYERPKRFNRLGLWALAEEFISPAKAMELLHVSAAEIELAMVGPDESYS
ncbi:MAG: transcriptional regulator [Gammaproteobacteria bacterium]|nr:MAG: transcriptional regulator [Gammaproteobacteria bacterium]